jgi:isochorismate synthase
MTALAGAGTRVDIIATLAERGIREAQSRGRRVVVSGWLRAPDGDPIVAFGRAEPGARALWLQADAGLAIVASGVAGRFVGGGRERFAGALAWWRDFMQSALVDTDQGPLRAPLCLGGFSFDPDARQPDGAWRAFADADLTAPAVALVWRGGEAWALLTVAVGPEDAPGEVATRLSAGLDRLLDPVLCDEGPEPPAAREEPDSASWREAVREATEAIARGALLKVVLAREVVARAAGPFSASAALRRLCDAYRACTIFAFERGGTMFLGATPERLVRLDGRRVQAACLAGSRPRGATPEEDDALARALRADRKERFEHALVVPALRDALEPVCAALTTPGEPALLRVRNVQHLYTPVEGVTREDTSALDLAARLHPTPAVGGVPRETALEVIRRSEPFDRGWYAGPVGWMDASGGGEFVVALRSALLSGSEARLYAGCGVVAGSDPGREWEESDVKLRAMRWALQLPSRSDAP